MRLFIAVKISNKLAEKLYDLQEDIPGSQIKWVEKSNFHITLHFLGDTDFATYQDICRDISPAISQIESFRFEAFGKGVFPNLNNPRVIWVGVNNHSYFKHIYEVTGKVLRTKGYNISKKYKPHITLGRVKKVSNNESLVNYIKKDYNLMIGEDIVENISIIESYLTNKGPTYEVLSKLELC